MFDASIFGANTIILTYGFRRVGKRADLDGVLLSSQCLTVGLIRCDQQVEEVLKISKLLAPSWQFMLVTLEVSYVGNSLSRYPLVVLSTGLCAVSDTLDFLALLGCTHIRASGRLFRCF